jgi:hypothetical protein
MNLYCKKCLCSGFGEKPDELGAPCQTPGCDGVIERQPEFRELVDELPEPICCGRRNDLSSVSHTFPDADRWLKFKSNGNRVCSYCGSLHPDDLFALVKASAEAPEDAEFGTVVEIEPSDKSYKIYVMQPGVRNAHEGGIKFYTHHLPRNADGSLAVTPEQNSEYARAVANSQKRFERRFEECPPHRV